MNIKNLIQTLDAAHADKEPRKNIIQADQIRDAIPVKPESRRDMRALAFYFIYAADRFDYTISLEGLIDNFRRGFNLEIADDSLAITMARGAIDTREELDEQIKPLLRNWKFERLGCCTRLVLRLALWEVNQEDSIPSIVINEAIELAKTFAEKDAYKFINGLLDEACRKMGKTPIVKKEKEEDNGDDQTRNTDKAEKDTGK